MRRRERLAVDSAEINLIPMLDMVSLLVQVLLLNVQFNAYAEVHARSVAAAEQALPQDRLDLQVYVGGEGYVVSWAEGSGREELRLPCPGGCLPDGTGLDTDGLRAVAVGLKGRHPDEDVAVVVPDEGTAFEALVRTMDVLREGADRAPLFPDIAIGDLE